MQVTWFIAHSALCQTYVFLWRILPMVEESILSEDGVTKLQLQVKLLINYQRFYKAPLYINQQPKV